MGMETGMGTGMEMGTGMKMEQGQGWSQAGSDAQLPLPPSEAGGFAGPSLERSGSTRTAWGCFSFPQPTKMTGIYENKSVVFKFCEAKRTSPL